MAWLYIDYINYHNYVGDNNIQDGYTALQLAVEKDHKEIITTLLQKGADIDIQNKVRKYHSYIYYIFIYHNEI